MAELNHTIVHAKDKRESAGFLADILGLALNCVDFRVPGQSGYGMYFNTAASKYYRS